MLGNAYELKGEYDKAIAEYQTAMASAGPLNSWIASVGHAHAMAGRKSDAQQILNQLQERSKHSYVSPYHVALIYIALGERDRALTWLEKAYDDHFWMIAFFKVDPRLDPLRSDPRFQNLQRCVGLLP
jgi:tetratricopeptide (TPR) repeat protein